ncbi:MAG: TolC family protein [Deltaproteobacteria bacterium]|nr:TolC family protein [Deltaproteobacteria bacterium]
MSGFLRISLLASALAVFFVLTLSRTPAKGADIGIYDAWRLALEYHEAVSISRESVTQSELDIDRAKAFLLPGVNIESTYTRYTGKKEAGGLIVQPDGSSKVEVKVIQSIYDGGKEWSGLRQAKKQRASAVTGLEDVRESVVIGTARAYYELLKDKKAFEIVEESLKRAVEGLRVSKARFEAGSATKADVLRGGAELAGKAAEVTRARSQVKDAEEVFRRITGIEGPFELSTIEFPFSVDMDVEGLLERAFEMRKDYRQKLINEEIAKEGIDYAKGNFWPSLSLQGVYAVRDQTPQTAFFLRDNAYAELVFEFPVFEGGLRRAELSKARSRARQAELERLAGKREIALDVRRSYNSMDTARSVIDAYKKEVTFAEENYQMVFKQYTYGLANSTDLIDAETNLVSAKLNLSRADYDYALSTLEVKRSAGVLLGEVEKSLSGMRGDHP